MNNPPKHQKIDYLVSYAQNHEDIIIAAFFYDVKKGTYIDIGANHPENDSVTQYFYNLGWSGVNVEPNVELYDMLKEKRPRDINVNVGISDKAGDLKFRQYDNSGLSTFSADMQTGYADSKDESISHFKDIKVKTITLEMLYDQFAIKHTHFLKVDVEGFEFNVLEGNNWEKYRPELVCIESNHINKLKLQSFFKDINYFPAFFDGLNEYYLAAESKHRLLTFAESYPLLIVSRPILSHAWEEHFKNLQKESEHYRLAADEYQKRIGQLEIALNEANQELKRYEGLRYTAKKASSLAKNKLASKFKTKR